jgi:LysM repeat protein
VLNVIISAITVGVVLQLWENDHPPLSIENTPVVVIVTATQPINQPLISDDFVSGTIKPFDAGVPISGTVQVTPSLQKFTYRVQEGDFLGNLAIQFNVSVADIMAVNDLTNPDSLYVGQVIFIPTSPLPTATPTLISPTIIASATPRPTTTTTKGPIPTSTPTAMRQEPQVLINSVIGIGVLENERVVLHRTGDGELSLAGWRLTDGKGNEYFFPQLTLYKDGAINLNTRTGQNTVVDLFWGFTSPIWKSGKIISIYDSQNNLRATYTIP